jgi:hypothetical protein
MNEKGMPELDNVWMDGWMDGWRMERLKERGAWPGICEG